MDLDVADGRVGAFVRAAAALPPFPGVGVLRPATLPAMPWLEQLGDPGEYPEVLHEIYRALLRARGRANWRTRLNRQDRPLLQACAEKLVEHDVQPGGWACWSLGLWGQPRPAPARWVWSAGRVEKNRGWYRREAEAYRTPRVVTTPAVRALYARYQGGLARILRGDALPEGWREAYDALLRAARREASREQTRIAAQVAAGTWVWGK